MKLRFGFHALATLMLLGGLQSIGLAAPTVTDILADQFKPRLTGIDISTPTAAQTASCTVELQTIKTLADGKKHTAWVLKDGQGRVLRKFHDSTGANSVDVYAYYKDGEEVCQKLLEGGVPAGPVLDTAQVMSSAQTKHRGMAAEFDWYRGTGIPIKFSRTPGSVRRAPPKFSAHAREILAEHGFSEDEIRRLADAGVLVEKRR